MGFLLVIYGLIGLNTISSCPAGGCSAAQVWQTYGPFYVSFYLGISLIIVGIILIVTSKYVENGNKAKAASEPV